MEFGWECHTNRHRISPIFAPEQLRLSEGRTPLYKPHGTAQHSAAPVHSGSIVLTQFDYFTMLERKRDMLRSFLEQMENNCVVFIGYSFQDMDIASMLHSMKRKSRERHWYAVFPRADSNVRSMYDRQYGINR